jgi:hypothetical protein
MTKPPFRPSSVSRALMCPAHQELSAAVPNVGSEAATEGTVLHLAAANALRVAEGLQIEEVPAWHEPYLTPERLAAVEAVVQTTVSLLTEVRMNDPHAVIMIETGFASDAVVPGMKGTADVVILSGDTMYLIDFKFGRMPVAVEESPQLLSYGSLARHDLAHVAEFNQFNLAIYQPFLNSFRSYACDLGRLLEFEDQLRRAWAATVAGEPANPGEHCRYCNGKSVCRAYAESLDAPALPVDAVLSLAERADIALRWKAIADAYPQIVAALEAEALGGAEVPGWKLVAARSNRRFSDQAAVAKRLTDSGMTDDQIYTRSLPTLSTLERALGSTQFASLLGDLVTKPEGKPTLVPSTDTRQAISTSVDSDFS